MSTPSSPEFGPHQFGLPYQPPPLRPAGQPEAGVGSVPPEPDFLSADEGTGGSPFPVEERKTGSWIFAAILVVLLLIGAGAYFSMSSFTTDAIKVGDCMGAVDRNTLKQVNCKTPGAVYKVIAVIENQKRPTAGANPCSTYEGVVSAYWQGGRDGTGRLLCLKTQ